MDKNQGIGIVLMIALVVVYTYFFAPKNENIQQPQVTDTTTTAPNKQETPGKTSQFSDVADSAQVENDSISRALQNEKFGIFSSVTQGEEKEFSIENDKIQIIFTNRGGTIKRVLLKEYDDYQYEPLVILDENSSQIDYVFKTAKDDVRLSDLFFEASEPDKNGDTISVNFVANIADGKSISHSYRLEPGKYQVSHKMLLNGLSKDISGETVKLIWDNDLKRQETDIKYSRNWTTINYYLSEGKMEELKARSSDKQEVSIASSINWMSFKQKFFSTGLVFGRPVTNGYLSSSFNENDTLTVKSCKTSFELPVSYFDQETNPEIYFFGPNRLPVLNKVTKGFSENLYLGWPVINWINKYVIINIFTFLEKYIGSYGLIIIILVIILKLVLSPLTYKSHISMAKTKALKPELDELKEKFGKEPQKMQAEQMKLYQQVGVNPLSGCIPMLLQMPILFAMFQFIPHAIELRHQSFLWAHDLSTYDSILTLPFDIPGYGSHVSLFTLLMTVSTILYTWINSQSTAQMQGPMKTMQYFMPVIFMFVLNSYPAGLTFYYFVSNILSFGQIALIRRFVDDEKIRNILEENKKKNKNKKKSKFQLKLEEAMKASEESKKKKK